MNKAYDISIESCESSLDSSVPFLYADNAAPLLKNPDRGFRMESYISLGKPLEAYPTNPEDPYEKLKGFFEKYKAESPMILQAYVYLSKYRRKKLDPLAFSQMKKYFELCRDNNIRILLRFAYGTESTKDASYSRVAKHLKQIGEWFEQERDLINDTLYAVQGGIVGYWGEGHSYRSFKARNIGKAFDDLCEIVPKHLFVQIRYITLADRVSEKHQKRLAMHHDYIIGDLKHEWGYVLPKEREEGLLKYFSTTSNDGELPWGRAYMNDNPKLEALNDMPADRLLPEIARYHLSSLSLEHSYREDEGANRPYTLERWRNFYYNEDDLKALNLPYNPNLFRNADGSEAKLSAFEYLQYHLGYNLVLSNAKLRDGEFSFSITNFGLAAPNNFNSLSLKVGSAIYEVEAFNKTALQPGQSLCVKIKVKEKVTPEMGVAIKLSTLKDLGICARFANDSKFENGFQQII